MGWTFEGIRPPGWSLATGPGQGYQASRASVLVIESA
jgi:hypothetical protein